MPKLEIIVLSKNKLLSVPNFCYRHDHKPRLPNLKVLDLSNNLISVVKRSTFYRQCFPRLQNLSLGFNKIKTLDKNFISHIPFIDYLSIENLDPNLTLNEYALNSSSLQYLYMGNKFNVLKYRRTFFYYTRKLRILDMTGVQFVSSRKQEEKIFQLFQPLTRLEELILNKTSLSTFPSSLFQLLPNLTKLYFDDCGFNDTHLKIDLPLCL